MVTEVLETPISGRDDKDNGTMGSPYATMYYDIAAASFVGDDRDEFVTHYYDSRHFRNYDPAEEEETTTVTRFRRPG